MTDLVATTAGVFPLPDRAREALADLKGRQKHDLIDGSEGRAVTAAYDRAREAVVGTQRAAGLDRVVEGQLRWDDFLAHPLAVHDAVETRGIVRYYDNNNFYREPVVTGPLVDEGGEDSATVDNGSAPGDLAADGDPASGDLAAGTGPASGDLAADHRAAADLLGEDDPPLQAVAPGPYTLADLATDEHYGDETVFLEVVADFLAGEVAALPDAATLFLLEPSLVAAPPGDGPDARASAAVDRVAAATDADVVVHTYWGALEEKVYAHLLDADVAAVGHDVVAAPEASATLLSEYGSKDDVALGLVDGTNTRVETPETVRERVAWVQDRLPGASFDTVYVTPTTELVYLPVEVFEAKLETLGAAAAAEVVA